MHLQETWVWAADKITEDILAIVERQMDIYRATTACVSSWKLSQNNTTLANKVGVLPVY